MVWSVPPRLADRSGPRHLYLHWSWSEEDLSACVLPRVTTPPCECEALSDLLSVFLFFYFLFLLLHILYVLLREREERLRDGWLAGTWFHVPWTATITSVLRVNGITSRYKINGEALHWSKEEDSKNRTWSPSLTTAEREAGLLRHGVEHHGGGHGLLLFRWD